MAMSVSGRRGRGAGRNDRPPTSRVRRPDVRAQMRSARNPWCSSSWVMPPPPAGPRRRAFLGACTRRRHCATVCVYWTLGRVAGFRAGYVRLLARGCARARGDVAIDHDSGICHMHMRGIWNDAFMPLLLLDLDNTLIDRDGAFLDWAETFVADHGLPRTALPWLTAIDGGGYVPRETVLGAARRRYRLDVPLTRLRDDYQTAMVKHA